MLQCLLYMDSTYRAFFKYLFSLMDQQYLYGKALRNTSFFNLKHQFKLSL